MKIIHCADLHLDSKMTANLTKEQVRDRRSELLRTFGKMVEYADKNGVRAILIAGDFFDTRQVSAETQRTILDIIWKYPAIDFLYLRGNHDVENFLSRLENPPENLCVFREDWVAYSYGEVVIHGVELDSDNYMHVYDRLQPDYDKFNIVALHGQISEYQVSGDPEAIPLALLRGRGIDYLALGHVHQFRMEYLDDRGVFCYSGCLEGRGFDECGPKGFVVLDIDERTKTATTEFVSVAARTVYTVEVDVTGVYTTHEAACRIDEQIRNTQLPSSSLVKFVLCGEVDVESEINLDFLEEQFQDYFYVVRISDATKLMINFDDYANDISLKGEFIRLVQATEHTQEEKTWIIRAGIQALLGEEIGL